MASKFSCKLTPLAEQDMDAALAYISETLCNGKAAIDLLDGIEHAIETICEFPYSAADCKMFLVTDEKIRHIPVGNYVMIYEIRESEKSICILRFRYVRTDPEKIVF